MFFNISEKSILTIESILVALKAMKRFIIILFAFYSFVYSQNQDKIHSIEYVNISSLSINNNYENYYSKTVPKEKMEPNYWLWYQYHSRVKFFERVSLSAGISLDWNINKTFVHSYILDLRLFSSRSNQNETYFSTFKPIRTWKWSDSFNGNGVTAKAGVGSNSEAQAEIAVLLLNYSKSKEIEAEEFEEKGYYKVNSFGISLGLTFN